MSKFLGRSIGVVNQKGGVGKTTFSLLAAYELAERGYKTLLIDNDPQHSITDRIFGPEQGDLPEAIRAGGEPRGVSSTTNLYKKTPDDITESIKPIAIQVNVDFIGTNDLLANVDKSDSFAQPLIFKKSIQKLEEHYDYILIDSGPHFGTIWTSTFIGAGAGVVIPVMYDPLSVAAMKNALEKMEIINEMVEDPTKVLGVVPMRYNSRPINVEQVSRQGVKEYADEYQVPMFRGLPVSTKYVEAIDLNVSLKSWAAKHKSYSALKFTVNELETAIAAIEEAA